jgi:hypothetical protein
MSDYNVLRTLEVETMGIRDIIRREKMADKRKKKVRAMTAKRVSSLEKAKKLGIDIMQPAELIYEALEDAGFIWWDKGRIWMKLEETLSHEYVIVKGFDAIRVEAIAMALKDVPGLQISKENPLVKEKGSLPGHYDCFIKQFAVRLVRK